MSSRRRSRLAVTRSLAFALMILFSAPGCVYRTDLMEYSRSRGATFEKPKEGKAIVLFLRPGRMAGIVSATVFDDQKLVAVLMDYTYAAYETTPGKHRFMVLSEAA